MPCSFFVLKIIRILYWRFLTAATYTCITAKRICAALFLSGFHNTHRLFLRFLHLLFFQKGHTPFPFQHMRSSCCYTRKRKGSVILQHTLCHRKQACRIALHPARFPRGINNCNYVKNDSQQTQSILLHVLR